MNILVNIGIVIGIIAYVGSIVLMILVCRRDQKTRKQIFADIRATGKTYKVIPTINVQEVIDS